ncbi:MAG: paraquat-inducible protein A [Hyphomicrobiaceae bacterium]|nr:paraquat-inducible protein A [Hyphomicrobiaceae bacterium]
MSLFIIGASVCLILGISLPAIKLTSFMFWSTEHSLLSAVEQLLADGQWFLGLVVLVFSIAFPIIKLLYLLMVATLPVDEIHRQHWRIRAIEWLGKWSMHDVLVLALMIFFIKSQGIYDASSLDGVYYFTAAIVLMILAYAYLPDAAKSPGRATARVDRPVATATTGGRDATSGPALIVLPSPPPAYRETASRGPDSRFATRHRPFRNFVLTLIVLVAAVCLALGLLLPVIRFTTVYVWTAEHSIASITLALYQNGEHFLCGVLFTFSILFPALKLLYLLTLLTSPDLSAEFRQRSVSTMEWLGRYSMTDVMVLALMIFYVNSSGYTEAQVQPGVYFFAASALMTMLAYGWANTAASQHADPIPADALGQEEQKAA